MNTPDPIVEDNRKYFKEIIQLTFDRAFTFMALIGTAGYAGMLAIWGWINPFLLRWQVLAIGALLGASLLVFMAFQLVGMFVMARQQMRFQRLIAEMENPTPANVNGAIQQNRADQLKLIKGLTRHWSKVLLVIAFPGLAGSLLLIGACVQHLITDP